MDMHSTTSTWQTRLNALGPGILMATAAIGGSHLVASTQAGAIFGWQLFWLIVVVNVLKYPFFRFGIEYTLATKKSLVEGYQSKGPWFFLQLYWFEYYSRHSEYRWRVITHSKPTALCIAC